MFDMVGGVPYLGMVDPSDSRSDCHVISYGVFCGWVPRYDMKSIRSYRPQSSTRVIR